MENIDCTGAITYSRFRFGKEPRKSGIGPFKLLSCKSLIHPPPENKNNIMNYSLNYLFFTTWVGWKLTL